MPSNYSVLFTTYARPLCRCLLGAVVSRFHVIKTDNYGSGSSAEKRIVHLGMPLEVFSRLLPVCSSTSRARITISQSALGWDPDGRQMEVHAHCQSSTVKVLGTNYPRSHSPSLSASLCLSLSVCLSLSLSLSQWLLYYVSFGDWGLLQCVISWEWILACYRVIQIDSWSVFVVNKWAQS